MKKIRIFIPVATFEPLSIIKKSLISQQKLIISDLDVKLIYIVDCPDGADERIQYLQNENIENICRLDTRGRRAGAINDGLQSIRKPDGTLNADYIALFDVDSRPDPDFLLQCTSVLKRDSNSVIASGVRYIINKDSGWVAGSIAAEYTFFEDVYRLSEKYDGFKQFNGLIGVIKAHAFDDMQLNEQVYCEDLDFTQNIYISGKKPVLAETKVGEQAPTTIKEVYNQRVRWMSGSLEGLAQNIISFPRAQIPITRRIAWFISMTLPFVAFILMPFVLIYSLRLWAKGHDHVIIKTSGLLFHVWLITFCGAVAIKNRLFNKKTIWAQSKRTDI
ncbi:MAG: glycosyltransferase family 2 protein [Methanosarcinales archaeon]|nr:glycosyltransferase family 2 protein [Methanosarcinales archaeon]